MKVRIVLLALWFVASIGGLLAIVLGLFHALAGSRHSLRVSVGFDQTVNAAIGGDEDESISSRAGKGQLAKVRHWCVLCKLLDIVQKDHCKLSIEADEGQPVPVVSND